jgi:hypothetical protein
MKQIIIFICAIILLVPPVFGAEFISVKVPVANIRSGPSESSDLLWKVEAYHPLIVLEKKVPGTVSRTLKETKAGFSLLS